MLADFNISSQPVGSEPGGEELFGGTFVYMSPEHLDAFNPSHPAGHDAVTARSDMYSLGLVLQQLLEGRMQFGMPERKPELADTLQAMSTERRREQPACRHGIPNARKTLQRTISRCLDPEPKDRFSSGAELAEQLDGCRQLRHAERQLTRLPHAIARIAHRPFLWLVLLVILPQIAGSIVNIAYNTNQIVERLSPGQQRRFDQLVILYNAVVYPLAVVLFVRAVYPVWRCWNALSGTAPLSDGEVEAARRQALQLASAVGCRIDDAGLVSRRRAVSTRNPTSGRAAAAEDLGAFRGVVLDERPDRARLLAVRRRIRHPSRAVPRHVAQCTGLYEYGRT
jgi:hypothetical protein